MFFFTMVCFPKESDFEAKSDSLEAWNPIIPVVASKIDDEVKQWRSWKCIYVNKIRCDTNINGTEC